MNKVICVWAAAFFLFTLNSADACGRFACRRCAHHRSASSVSMSSNTPVYYFMTNGNGAQSGAISISTIETILGLVDRLRPMPGGGGGNGGGGNGGGVPIGDNQDLRSSLARLESQVANLAENQAKFGVVQEERFLELRDKVEKLEQSSTLSRDTLQKAFEATTLGVFDSKVAGSAAMTLPAETIYFATEADVADPAKKAGSWAAGTNVYKIRDTKTATQMRDINSATYRWIEKQ